MGRSEPLAPGVRAATRPGSIASSISSYAALGATTRCTPGSCLCGVFVDNQAKKIIIWLSAARRCAQYEHFGHSYWQALRDELQTKVRGKHSFVGALSMLYFREIIVSKVKSWNTHASCWMCPRDFVAKIAAIGPAVQ